MPMSVARVTWKPSTAGFGAAFRVATPCSCAPVRPPEHDPLGSSTNRSATLPSRRRTLPRRELRAPRPESPSFASRGLLAPVPSVGTDEACPSTTASVAAPSRSVATPVPGPEGCSRVDREQVAFGTRGDDRRPRGHPREALRADSPEDASEHGLRAWEPPERGGRSPAQPREARPHKPPVGSRTGEGLRVRERDPVGPAASTAGGAPAEAGGAGAGRALAESPAKPSTRSDDGGAVRVRQRHHRGRARRGERKARRERRGRSARSPEDRGDEDGPGSDSRSDDRSDPSQDLLGAAGSPASSIASPSGAKTILPPIVSGPGRGGRAAGDTGGEIPTDASQASQGAVRSAAKVASDDFFPGRAYEDAGGGRFGEVPAATAASVDEEGPTVDQRVQGGEDDPRVDSRRCSRPFDGDGDTGPCLDSKGGGAAEGGG